MRISTTTPALLRTLLIAWREVIEPCSKTLLAALKFPKGSTARSARESSVKS